MIARKSLQGGRVERMVKTVVAEKVDLDRHEQEKEKEEAK